MFEPEKIQVLSPEQWDGIRNTVSALNESEATSGLPLEPQWRDLVNHWTAMLVASTGDIAPFAITEHFLWLLRMYLDGAPDEKECGSGSIAVMQWANTVLELAAGFALTPQQGSEQCCYVVVGDSCGGPDSAAQWDRWRVVDDGDTPGEG